MVRFGDDIESDDHSVSHLLLGFKTYFGLRVKRWVACGMIVIFDVITGFSCSKNGVVSVCLCFGDPD